MPSWVETRRFMLVLDSGAPICAYSSYLLLCVSRIWEVEKRSGVSARSLGAGVILHKERLLAIALSFINGSTVSASLNKFIQLGLL